MMEMTNLIMGSGSRRDALRSFVNLMAVGCTAPVSALAADPNPTIDIGGRRELFVDSHLIQRMTGAARQVLHHPIPREVSLVHDAPWEGSGSGYHSVFQDGDLYRMYYKAWHLQVTKGRVINDRHPLFCCYAESQDGVNWRKPHLGRHNFAGSKQNNIVMISGKQGALNVDAGHPAVFVDDNPEAPASARYKAILRSSGSSGLLPFQSANGLDWKPMTDKPILAGLGAFDSQNLAFWDPNVGRYRAYWRIFNTVKSSSGTIIRHRAIRTALSDDLLVWDKHQDLTYADSPIEELYTNQVKPYPRAPHILIGFPTRYIDRGWSDSMRALPERKHRELRSSASQRYGTAVTEGLLMASRDGVRFQRWNEAFLRPGIQRPGSWHYGQQYIAWHVVQTKSSLPGAPDELSCYAGENYWTGRSSSLRRYSLRLDGFVSIQAPRSGGELITRPLTFDGRVLHVNFSTSAAGTLRVELQHPDGTAIPGFSVADCHEIFGDAIDRPVTWKNGADVSGLRGRPVRIRFHLQDADLYAFRFVQA